MSKPKVYFAGPITGLSYAEARLGWRADLADLLEPHIDCFSPMRTKNFLAGEKVLRGDPVMYENPLATSKGILTRDFNDVKNCDAMIANFLGANKVSIGTCVEFGFAHALRKPVVLVMEKPLADHLEWANVHEHAFLTQIAGYRTDNLEDAAEILRAILLPGV